MNKLLTIFLLFSTNTFAGLFDSKLQLYSCPNMDSANQCNSLCTKEKGYEIEPKINKNSSIVMIARFQDGKVSGGSTEENCRIIDNKNWSCTRETHRSFSEKKMVNGQYSAYHFISLPNNKSSEGHTCAK